MGRGAVRLLIFSIITHTQKCIHTKLLLSSQCLKQNEYLAVEKDAAYIRLRPGLASPIVYQHRRYGHEISLYMIDAGMVIFGFSYQQNSFDGNASARSPVICSSRGLCLEVYHIT